MLSECYYCCWQRLHAGWEAALEKFDARCWISHCCSLSVTHPELLSRQVALEGFMWKSSSLLHSWTRISNEVTSKVALLCYKISCAWVAKVVWGRGYLRCPFEGHLSKSRPLVQSVTATRENQEGGKWRLELTGLVGGRKRTSNVLCRNLSDFFSQLLLMKDLDSVVRPAEIIAKVPLGNVVTTQK